MLAGRIAKYKLRVRKLGKAAATRVQAFWRRYRVLDRHRCVRASRECVCDGGCVFMGTVCVILHSFSSPLPFRPSASPFPL